MTDPKSLCLRYHFNNMKACLFMLFMMAVMPLALFSQSRANFEGPAVVIAVKGPSYVVAGANRKMCYPGLVLRSGDSVLVVDGAQVGILDITGKGRELKVNSLCVASKRTVGGVVGNAIEGFERIDLWFEKDVPDYVAQRFRSDDEETVQLDFPRNTKLTSSPKALSWHSQKSFREFDLSIRCYENDFTMDDQVAGSSYSLSRSAVPLEPGRKYFWSVHPVGADPSTVAAGAWFTVMDEDELRRYTEEFKTLNDIMTGESDYVFGLLRANLLMRFGLLQDARILLEALIKKEPANLAAERLIANLYAEMGFRPDALSAIELSQKMAGH